MVLKRINVNVIALILHFNNKKKNCFLITIELVIVFKRWILLLHGLKKNICKCYCILTIKKKIVFR